MTSEKKYTAKNGIPIYVYENPASHGFFISLFLKSGAMYEAECESGITHFLEHVAIRNVNHRMNGELYPLLDKHGIEFNASTYSEMVQFYLTGARSKFRIGADVIGRLFDEISLPPSEIDKERDRIRAEIRESGERTSLASFTLDKVFSGTSLSGSITGSAGSVSRITRKKLEDYRRRVFTKENLFIYVTGSVTGDDIKYLSDTVGTCEVFSGEDHNNVAPVPLLFGKRDAGVYLKNADFTKVRFTFDLDMLKLSLPVVDILYDTMLGGYNSSFFVELSEKRGLFYDLSGATERYKNIGTLSFSYELRESKIEQAVSETVRLLKSLKERELPEDSCMKAGYVDNAYLLYDDIRELNFTLAYDNHVMDSGYSKIEDRLSAYSRVTPKDVMNASRIIFTPDNLTVTLKGNKNKINTSDIRRIVKTL